MTRLRPITTAPGIPSASSSFPPSSLPRLSLRLGFVTTVAAPLLSRRLRHAPCPCCSTSGPSHHCRQAPGLLHNLPSSHASLGPRLHRLAHGGASPPPLERGRGRCCPRATAALRRPASHCCRCSVPPSATFLLLCLPRCHGAVAAELLLPLPLCCCHRSCATAAGAAAARCHIRCGRLPGYRTSPVHRCLRRVPAPPRAACCHAVAACCRASAAELPLLPRRFVPCLPATASPPPLNPLSFGASPLSCHLHSLPAVLNKKKEEEVRWRPWCRNRWKYKKEMKWRKGVEKEDGGASFEEGRRKIEKVMPGLEPIHDPVIPVALFSCSGVKGKPSRLWCDPM